ncbi:helix-turn-helix transcriptional regulator [Rossellomorea vietnamensis]|uniref:Helix-turn-helix transcriptional regulator n=1 Tax=Rossellomorea vietnamensis TaxID=218284 RepID=A0A5D4KFE8_9BACI|nr:helix-turn-helix transcriptional regulator [Rossellomorea vietnamensis]TYR75540.1 helix-turn-helix transcriptional regulator [Rossellomorea vietnamensis]
MQNIGSILRDLRKKNKLTLIELGEKIDFNYSNLSKIERGERKPTFELLESLSDLYGVPMADFFRERKTLSEEMFALEDDIEERKIKWMTLIDESEDKGYSPDELREIIKLVENIRKKDK